MQYMKNAQDVNRRTLGEPEWVVFSVGDHCVRLPFADRGNDADSGWQYLLDITMIGFRADRVGDTIFVTGRPFGFEGGVA